MLREPLSRRSLLNLRAALKGYSAESVALRKKKTKPSKNPMAKVILSMDRLYLGSNIRYHHLAYGFLKGLDYKTMEKTTERKFSTYDFERIYNVIKLFSPWTATYMKVEDIRNWVVDGTRYFLTPEEMTAKIQERNAKRKEAQRQC